MYSLITLAVAAAIISLSLFVFRKNEKFNFELYMKLLSVVFCVFGIFTFFLADSFVEVALNFSDPLQSIIRWGYYIGFVILPLAVFIDFRLFRNIAVYFYLPMTLLCTVFFDGTMEYFFDPQAGGLVIAPALRYILRILELAVALSIPTLIFVHYEHRFDIKNKEEIFNFAVGLPLVLFTNMPSYIPQSTVGYTDMQSASFSLFHLFWVLFIVLVGVALYLVFSKKSQEDRFKLCIYLALSELVHTMTVFFRGFELSRIPLQLCCTSGFFYVFALAMKNKRVSDFCYLANTVGAVIAIILADFSSDAMTFWNVHYMTEHTLVVLVPILSMALGVFTKVDRTAIKHTLQVFACYFLFCFFIGTLINGLDTSEGYPVNYFYMFNLSTALDYLPFVGFTGAIHWVFGGFEVYPILVLSIFVLFSLLFVGFYYLTRGIYKWADSIRASKAAKCADASPEA